MNSQELERLVIELGKQDLEKALSLVEREGRSIPPFLRAGIRSRAFDAAGDLRSAAAEIRPFLKTDNSPWQLRFLYAKYLSKSGQPKEALEVARSAYGDSKGNHDALMVLLHVLLDSSEYVEALSLIEPRLQEKTTPKGILLAGASCYRASGDLEKAIEIANRIIAASPEDHFAYRLKADSIAEEDSNEGIKVYEQALAAAEIAKANSNATKWNMSLHLLRTRDFKRGWEFWELGSTKEVGTMGRVLPPFLQSVKRLDPKLVDARKWSVVVAEQGIGDQVLFLSALNDFLRDSPKTIVVSDHRMTDIVQRSFPSVVVVKPGFLDILRDLAGLPMNGYIPMGSLLATYRKKPEDFLRARSTPFLTPKGESVTKFRKLIMEKADGRPIIGISWKGGFWQGQKRNKSMSLRDWEPIFRSPAMLVNLQYGDIDDDVSQLTLEQKAKFVTFPRIDFKKDLESWLAITCACDGIISISTALVHFAAAAGITTKIVMPVRQGPWILGMDDKGHLAYGSAHIYRRQGSEDFSDLLARVAKMIE